jgi:uncharacterized membrane protein SirB2
MIEFYSQIKWVHVSAVVCSGMLFLVRGLLMLGGRGAWVRRTTVRYLSYTIDSVLLTAALMLATMLPSELFSNGWLGVKLALLVVYIALGVVALRDGGSPRRRALCFASALVVFGLIVSIARTHHPLGLFAPWFT